MTTTTAAVWRERARNARQRAAEADAAADAHYAASDADGDTWAGDLRRALGKADRDKAEAYFRYRKQCEAAAASAEQATA